MRTVAAVRPPALRWAPSPPMLHSAVLAGRVSLAGAVSKSRQLCASSGTGGTPHGGDGLHHRTDRVQPQADRRSASQPPPTRAISSRGAGTVQQQQQQQQHRRAAPRPSAPPPPQLPLVPSPAAGAAASSGSDTEDEAAALLASRAAGLAAAAADSLPTGMSVSWLGTSSGAPTLIRNTSSTLLRLPGHTYMVDCGEGTFRQLLSAGFDASTIRHVFITHMHGDHCFGLGSTLGIIADAHQRKMLAAAGAGASGGSGSGSGAAAAAAALAEEHSLHVYGPPGVSDLLHAQLVMTGLQNRIRVPLYVTEWVLREQEAHDFGHPDHLTRFLLARRQASTHLPAIPGVHAPRPPPPLTPRHLDYLEPAPLGFYWGVDDCGPLAVGAAMLKHRVPCWGYAFYERAPRDGCAPRKVVILGDTMNSNALLELARDADLLSHEATYGDGMEAKAVIATHSTAGQAGAFAGAVGARQLVLTHFSARYHTGEPPAGRFGGGGADRGGGRPGGGRSGGGAALNEAAVSALEAQRAAELEVSLQCKAVKQLVAQAEAAAGTRLASQVVAAYDGFTFHVPERSL